MRPGGASSRLSMPHERLREAEPELYIADRSNRRAQLYDADGAFKRSFGTDLPTSPSGASRATVAT